MDIEIREFITYLHNTKKTSANTEISYQRDLKKMAEFLKERGIRNYKDVKELELEGYISYMEREKFASSSISRSVASMRAFFQYLWKEGVIAEDPADNLKPPKVEKRTPEILTIEEVDKLLQQPKLDTPKGIRDSAMLELLYATGMRVSEMLHLQIFDVNLQFGYVVCNENGKERIIPIGIPCKKAMERYLQTARTVFVKDEKETALFTNCSGKAMSRQGFWKVLKGYADDAGIKRDIAPHTLRHSFAVHMLQNGADIRSVQEMLGHSDISTTQVYLGMNMNKMRDVYMKHIHVIKNLLFMRIAIMLNEKASIVCFEQFIEAFLTESSKSPALIAKSNKQWVAE